LKFKLKWIAAPILSFALFAPFAAVLPAQEPAAQSAPAAGQHQTAEQVKDRSSESNEYRFMHSKLVRSISGVIFHDSNAPEEVREAHVDITARVFLWINFAIIVFAIVIPLARIMPKVLRNRRETLSRNLEEARKTTADANSRLSAVEAQLSKLDEEIARIRTQVEEEIKGDEARIKSSIGEESARVVAAAEQEIAMAAAQAQRSLKAFAADLAIDQAVKQLTLTAENDCALIEEFVAQTEAGSGNGGKN
jgi:F-type H+-transporting ATPase subunit b